MRANSLAPTAFAPSRARRRSTPRRFTPLVSRLATRCVRSLRTQGLLGRDTRESSPWIAATLAAGLRQAGAQVESAGVVTTPAVAFLARTHGFHAGVVISASHNPWQDNGIKLFGGDGFKLPDAAGTGDGGGDPAPRRASRRSRSAALPPVEDNPLCRTTTSNSSSTPFPVSRSPVCRSWPIAPMARPLRLRPSSFGA